MHTVFGKVVKYVLWTLFAVIVILLLVGLAKFNRNVGGYVQFLNGRSRSESRNEGGIAGIFWQKSTITVEEASTGDVVSGVAEMGTGMDVYDPSFEDELNQIPQEEISTGDQDGTMTDFGFVNPDASVASGDSRDELLDLIKEREMK